MCSIEDVALGYTAPKTIQYQIEVNMQNVKDSFFRTVRMVYTIHIHYIHLYPESGMIS